MHHPVLAAKSGIVKTGYVKGGMGKYVKISHLDRHVTVYGHLGKITVKTGFWVWQGQKIGEVGKTGNANYRKMDPHVHFEIRNVLYIYFWERYKNKIWKHCVDPELFWDERRKK